MNTVDLAPLGQATTYTSQYDPTLLFPIPRNIQRAFLPIQGRMPFIGNDLWFAYEFSWLNARGKPEVAILTLTIPCDSPNLVESKSLKLYFNSFTGTTYASVAEVQNIVEKDLSAVVQATVSVQINRLHDINSAAVLGHFSGFCLDTLDIACDTYEISPAFLQCTAEQEVSEVLFSHLLKSNCLKTGQPDWGSVQISYTGKQIDREGLLRYIISFRNHQGFGEDCIERMFVDILNQCAPRELTIDGRYTRRGGIDINPLRTNLKHIPTREPIRMWRQ